MGKRRVIILGAAGRDFHDFNTYFRNNPSYEVICFTATQIPDIEGRLYPPELSGHLYPKGVPIYSEDRLPELIKKYDVDEVVLSYSDLSHDTVMHKASIALANGANFRLLGPKDTMLKSSVPVIAICAVRTGCGKSQTTRKACEILKSLGKKVVVIRHPMPYGDLKRQIWQRFETLEDMDRHECTIEEREEYEPHIRMGNIVYAGVDYEEILKRAEQEADVIVWDGGNNDYPFYKPDILIVVADPHRAGHELKYHPGEANARMADAVIINKVETAEETKIDIVVKNIREINPNAKIIYAKSPVKVEKAELIKNKRVVVIEDGPTLTHGEMEYGAGMIAAKNLGANEIVDPRSAAVGSIKEVYEKYTHLGSVLPAMGYGKKQIKDLEETINKINCDAVIIGTPIDLRRLININKPAVRVIYDLKEVDGDTTLTELISGVLQV